MEIYVHPTLGQNIAELEAVKSQYGLVESLSRTKHLLVNTNRNIRNTPKKTYNSFDGNNGGDAA